MGSYGAIVSGIPAHWSVKFIYSENYADVDEAHYDLDSTDRNEAYFYSANQFNEQKTYELQFLSMRILGCQMMFSGLRVYIV